MENRGRTAGQPRRIYGDLEWRGSPHLGSASDIVRCFSSVASLRVPTRRCGFCKTRGDEQKEYIRVVLKIIFHSPWISSDLLRRPHRLLYPVSPSLFALYARFADGYFFSSSALLTPTLISLRLIRGE